MNILTSAKFKVKNRKWALVKWDKVCLPKIAGGMGLRDPEHSNRAMGANIWWRWLAYPNTPWASLWMAKYTRNCPIEERIRLTELSTGLVLWNSALQQRSLIQEHSFWEIRNGHSALFWEDAWQQLPKLEKPKLARLKQKCQNEGRHRVQHYWN